MGMSKAKFTVLLYGLLQMLRAKGRKHPSFARRLAEKDLTVQIRTFDGAVGRHFTFKAGNIASARGVHPHPDVTISVASAELGARLFVPWVDHLERIEAMKNFNFKADGPDELVVWFTQTVTMMMSVGWEYGTDAGDGTKRYVTNTNGGPLFVYVKDGKIVRLTPIEFDAEDARPWTINARGKAFTPPPRPRRPCTPCARRATVYSPDRLLYPMKRVDFDPKGERNCQNRGISGYERISWDEALDLVAREIKRCKTEHGQGAIMGNHGSHHTWGNIGYYISSAYKFFNAIGYTRVVHNPDSWEGWYWGAMHHYGYSMRLGQTETYSTGRGSAEGSRDGGVLGGRPGGDERLLQRVRGHDPPDVAAGARHRGRAHRPLLQPHRGAARRQVDRAQARHRHGDGARDRARLDHRGPLRQEVRRRAHDRLRDVARLHPRQGRRRRRRRRSGRRPKPACRRRTCARSRASGERRRPISAPAAGATATAARAARRPASSGRARWPACSRCRAWGGPASTTATCNGARRSTYTSISPATPTAASRATSRTPACRSASISACRSCRASIPSSQKVPRLRIPEAILEGKAEGYPWNGKTIEGQFEKFSYPAARPFADPHVLQVRRRVDRHHDRHQPLREGLPDRQARVRREPVDLVRGRGEVRRRHPAGLHPVRALGHQRVRRHGRLRAARADADEPPRHPHAAQVHRAAGRVEVRFPDLPGARDPARPRRLLLGGHERARLGEAAVRRLRSAASTSPGRSS